MGAAGTQDSGSVENAITSLAICSLLSHSFSDPCCCIHYHVASTIGVISYCWRQLVSSIDFLICDALYDGLVIGISAMNLRNFDGSAGKSLCAHPV